jgi:hypothetical protein
VSTLRPAYVGEVELQIICPGGYLELTGAPSPKIAAVSGQETRADILKVTLRFTVVYPA